MRHLPHVRSLSVGIATAVLLGACGGSTSDDSTGSAENQLDAAAAADDQQDAESEAQPEADSDPPPTDTPVLTAEDGFTPLHDFELPEPGHATLVVDGETIDLRIRSCTDPTQIISEEGSQANLFGFSVEAEGETADGRKVMLAAQRSIATVEFSESSWPWHDLESGAGQSRGALEIFTMDVPSDGETTGLAELWSPSGADPTGERLPVLHVDTSGAFTADEEIQARPPSPEGTLEGRFQLAGQCAQR